MKKFSVSAGLFAGLFACGLHAQGMFGPAPEISGKAVYYITPTTADPGLKTSEDEPNLAALPKGTPRPNLFLWLPGTNGHPKGDASIEATALSGGYRVIGLQYNNHGTVEKQCETSGDPECNTREREERFRGDAPTASIPNTPEEGVEHRLTMLLKYLVAQHPDEGWGQYLDGDKPRWSKIVLAGHSQGASMTGYIAKQVELARVMMLSGGADGVGLTPETRKWSSWVTATTGTPMDRWYVAYSDKELISMVEPDHYLKVLKVPADHVLTFKLDLPATTKMGKGLEAHMSTPNDPRYRPAWLWMMGATDVKPAM